MRDVGIWIWCWVIALAMPALADPGTRIDPAGLSWEATANHALAAYLQASGLPDVAECHPINAGFPWDDHEVVLTYLDRGTEIAFARAFMLGEPSVGIARWQRVLPVAEIDRLRFTTTSLWRVGDGDPLTRAEEAAAYAEATAARIQATATEVDHAVDRAERAARTRSSR